MLRIVPIVLIIGLLAGCSSLMGTATTRLTENLSAAILNQNDPETVRLGAPAYLLLIDGLIEEAPEDISRLLTGAKLYSAYADVFVNDEQRARRLAARALDYARRALCLHAEEVCQATEKPYDTFKTALHQTTVEDVPVLYGFGCAWSSNLQANSGDWTIIANLPKITAVLRRVVVLHEQYEHSGAHLYLGVLATQLPPHMGGKPNEARAHFERVIELSHGRHLMAKVMFARHYARLLYNRTLHDQLLTEVLAAEPAEPGLTLLNTLAQQQARELLDSADDYF